MRDLCPNCDAELTENLDCQQCGFGTLLTSDDEPEVGEEALPVDAELRIDSEEEESLSAEEISDALESVISEGQEQTVAPSIISPTTTAEAGSHIDFVTTGHEIKQEIHYHRSEVPPPEPQDKPLFEFTQPLPPAVTYAFPPHFAGTELKTHAQRLTDDHLILISCPDEDIAFSAAYKVIDALNLPYPLKKRLLNLDKAGADGPQPSIYNLIKKRDPDEHIVILADATTEKGKQFLQPILTAGRSASSSIQDDLRQNNMYLICLINLGVSDDSLKPDNAATRRERDLKFHCWRPTFLRRLLELHDVPDLDQIEADLKRQRELGWWNPNDSEFYYEVRSLVLRGEIKVQIKEKDDQPPLGSVTELFKGNEPLSDTVLYVASFFPNLTPYEFNQLVAKLLIREDASLNDWHAVPDRILGDCKLATTPTRDAATGVNFINHSLRDNLREYLNRHKRFFLENKFQQLQELGLIFDRSPRLSQSAIKLSVEMANSYPEYYGSEWLTALVVDFEKFLAVVEPGEVKTWRFIDEINPAHARKRFYQTIAALLREMLQPRMSEVISDFLDELLFLKHYASILEIIRRLQFEPAFDQFRWLKQLFHRGDPQIREQAKEYIRNYLKRTGVRVPQALASLEQWLPTNDRPLDNPARYALGLIHSYFDQTVSNFDKRYFGAWPSTCPLFAFKDYDEATEKLELLVRLVFHPSLERLYSRRLNPALVDRRVNNLITNWFFMLRGPASKESPHRLDRPIETDKPLDGVAVCGMLLRAIASVTTPTQQTRLLAHWQKQNGSLLRNLGQLRYGSAAWQELAWKRELLGELVASYEQLSHSTVVLTETIGIGARDVSD
jgi:hypothetical protein